MLGREVAQRCNRRDGRSTHQRLLLFASPVVDAHSRRRACFPMETTGGMTHSTGEQYTYMTQQCTLAPKMCLLHDDLNAVFKAASNHFSSGVKQADMGYVISL